jgi:hypothetical protein
VKFPVFGGNNGNLGEIPSFQEKLIFGEMVPRTSQNPLNYCRFQHAGKTGSGFAKILNFLEILEFHGIL